jgi:hypothetical protein
MTDTYDLGMAVLFLEKLGDARDKALIQSLALRLVAGQSPAGGWDYKCPTLTAAEERQLLKFLQRNRPKADFLIMLPAEAKDLKRSAGPPASEGLRQLAPKLDERRSADPGKGLREPAPKASADSGKGKGAIKR